MPSLTFADGTPVPQQPYVDRHGCSAMLSREPSRAWTPKTIEILSRPEKYRVVYSHLGVQYVEV
jgi:hypothetical protein